MRLHDLSLPLDPASPEPMYRQLAQGITEAIARKVLKPGALLPGTRALAEHLHIARNTVILAYSELAAEGWVEQRVGSGTMVCLRPPDPARTPTPDLEGDPEDATAFDFITSQLGQATDPAQDAALDMRDGWPDPRLFPVEDLAQAYRRLLSRRQSEVLGLGDSLGHLRLRQELAAWLGERRGIFVGVEQILITRGSRHALSLLTRALLRPGDAVVVENPGHPDLWEVLRMARARILPLPVDAEGLQLEALEAILAKERPRLLCCSPQSQFPTGAVLSESRRQRLLELAAEARMAVAEVDRDAEWTFGEPLPLPLASQGSAGSVLFLGSFLNLLAPGLRLGFLVAKASIVERLARLGQSTEAQGDRALEAAVAALMADGTLARHVRRARRVYQERRNLVAARLAPLEGIHAPAPRSGLGFWAELRDPGDMARLLAQASAQGLLFHGEAHYDLHGSAGTHLRLGFGGLNTEELGRALDGFERLF